MTVLTMEAAVRSRADDAPLLRMVRETSTDDWNDSGALADVEFDGHACTLRTLRTCTKACHDLVGAVRDVLVPHPDREGVRP